MSGVNKVILVGRVGKDPEVRNLDSGATVANFSMATSESYKDKTTGEKKETTEWHNIVLWRSLADIAAKYVHKGDLLYIEGKLQTRSWEKDGVKRYTTEIVASNMTMLGSKSGNSTSAPRQGSAASEPDEFDALPSTASQINQPSNTTDDLPF